MDTILSTRIDDRIAKKINDLAMKMHATKKSVIENAIELLGKKIEAENGIDVFDETCGVWERKENITETVSAIRSDFRKSMHRYEK